MLQLDWSQMTGPLSGLALSTYFCFQFLQKFEKSTETMVNAFRAELEECNKRYNFILSELMKLKDSK